MLVHEPPGQRWRPVVIAFEAAPPALDLEVPPDSVHDGPGGIPVPPLPG